MTRYRVPIVVGIVAIALALVGVYEWQLQGSSHRVGNLHHQFRRHPLRAELLWAAGALLAVIAVEMAVLERRRRAIGPAVARRKERPG
jgi:hypothetical protein